MFVVIDTWNGEGYSSANGVDARIFNNSVDAVGYAFSKAKKEADSLMDATMSFETATQEGEPELAIRYYDDKDAGSYQLFRVCNDSHAVVININCNEARVYTDSMLTEFLNQLASEGKIEDRDEDFYELEDGDIQYLSEVQCELDQQFVGDLDFVEERKDGESETWEDPDGNQYNIPMERVRNWSGARLIK